MKTIHVEEVSVLSGIINFNCLKDTLDNWCSWGSNIVNTYLNIECLSIFWHSNNSVMSEARGGNILC